MRKAEKESMEAAKVEAITELRGILKPGMTVYTILRHVSRSGMMRVIGVFTIINNEPRDLTYLVSQALTEKLDRDRWGLKVSGCGMDMGFHVVYNLGSAMFPDGFKAWPGYWRNEPMDHDPDGGYALKHKWI